jgi:PilZ domain
MKRLRETQRVGLGIGEYSLSCVVVALESDEAVLLPLREDPADRLPVFSANGSLVFHAAGGAIVMLRGVVRYDAQDDLAFFSVGDGVGNRSVRRASRAPLMRPVVLTPAGGAPLAGMTTDLSCGGLGARVADPGPAGTAVAVALDVGDGEPELTCDAVVVGSRGATVAVRFGELTPGQERRLQRRVLGVLRRRALNAA